MIVLKIVGFLIAGIVGLGIIGGIIAAILEARAIKKCKKIIKETYGTTETFIVEILQTKKSEWQETEKGTLELKKEFFKDLSLTYDGSYKELRIAYKNTTMHRVRAQRDPEIKMEYSEMIKGNLTEHQLFIHKNLLKYLQDLFIQNQKEKRITEYEQKKNKASELKDILNSKNPLSTLNTSGFTFEKEENGRFVTAKISVNKTCYMLIHYDRETESVEYKYGFGEEVEIFERNKDDLLKLVKSLPQTIEEKENEIPQNFIEQYKQIQQNLKNIKAKEKWLSQESKHLISETIPSDLLSLFDVYIDYENKDEIEKSIMNTTEKIYKMITELEREIKENQKITLEIKQGIIDKR